MSIFSRELLWRWARGEFSDGNAVSTIAELAGEILTLRDQLATVRDEVKTLARQLKERGCEAG